jgi:hypothetical protein
LVGFFGAVEQWVEDYDVWVVFVDFFLDAVCLKVKT